MARFERTERGPFRSVVGGGPGTSRQRWVWVAGFNYDVKNGNHRLV